MKMVSAKAKAQDLQQCALTEKLTELLQNLCYT
jgi:hypothetical protein